MKPLIELNVEPDKRRKKDIEKDLNIRVVNSRSTRWKHRTIRILK